MTDTTILFALNSAISSGMILLYIALYLPTCAGDVSIISASKSRVLPGMFMLSFNSSTSFSVSSASVILSQSVFSLKRFAIISANLSSMAFFFGLIKIGTRLKRSFPSSTSCMTASRLLCPAMIRRLPSSSSSVTRSGCSTPRSSMDCFKSCTSSTL